MPQTNGLVTIWQWASHPRNAPVVSQVATATTLYILGGGLDLGHTFVRLEFPATAPALAEAEALALQWALENTAQLFESAIELVDNRPGPAGVTDHGALTGLADDDHLQYALLAGRAGGQVLNGSTLATENLHLRGTSNVNLGLLMLESPVCFFTPLNPAAAFETHAISYISAETYTAAFIGGGVDMSPTIDFTNSVFVWEGNRVAPLIRSGVAPSFAAFTLLQALPVLEAGAGATHNPLNPIILNAGAMARNPFAGTRTIANHTVIGASPQLQATVLGAIMNCTDMYGLNLRPTYSTVAFSTVNFGTIYGVRCQTPSVALFQPGAGTELMTAYYGLSFDNILLAGTRAAVRSLQTDSATSFFLLNTGGARSNFGGGLLLNCGQIQIFSDNNGLALGAAGGDVVINWNGNGLEFDPLSGADLRLAFGTTSHTWSASTLAEMRFEHTGFVFGSAAALGNQFFNVVAPLRSTNAAGEWVDVLLTQANSLIPNHAMTGIHAWVINAIALGVGTGSLVGFISTLTIGGMTTSGIGTNDTHAIRSTGRFTQRGTVQYEPIVPAVLSGIVNAWTGLITDINSNNSRYWARISCNAATTLNGIDATEAQDGDTFRLTNVGANALIIVNEAAAELTAANRILLGAWVSPLGINESIEITYDLTSARWRVVGQ